MSHPRWGRSADRIAVELVEADIEIGFNLVDLVETESGWGDPRRATRALQDAEEVFDDIERRLNRMGASESQVFAGLTGELRREIELARRHLSQNGRNSQNNV